jgi:hypothetical protein
MEKLIEMTKNYQQREASSDDSALGEACKSRHERNWMD